MLFFKKRRTVRFQATVPRFFEVQFAEMVGPETVGFGMGEKLERTNLTQKKIAIKSTVIPG